MGLRGQHSLHHVLIGAEGRHVAQRRPDERGEQRVVAREDQADVVPHAERRELVALLPVCDDARFEAVQEIPLVGLQLRHGLPGLR